MTTGRHRNPRQLAPVDAFRLLTGGGRGDNKAGIGSRKNAGTAVCVKYTGITQFGRARLGGSKGVITRCSTTVPVCIVCVSLVLKLLAFL